MSLVINVPAVETRLAQEAARHGVTAVDYAVRILTAHLDTPQETDAQTAAAGPAATPAEWERQFDTWVEGHPRRQPLPEDAFSRASFYERPE